MRLTHVVLSATLVAGTVGLVACGSDGDSDSSSTITMGNPATGGPDLPMFVAYEKGYFKDQGLDVTYTPANSPVLVQGLAGKKLNFATLPTGLMLSANAAGSDLVMISSISNITSISLYATKDVATAEDLAGKQVAVGNSGTSSNVEATFELDQLGVLDDVTPTIVSGSQPGILAAMEQGLVAAGSFSPPISAQATKDGFHLLTSGSTTNTPFVSGGVVVSKAYAADHPDVTKKVAAAMAQARTFIGDPANKDEVVALLAKDMGLTEDEAAAGYDQLMPIWTSTDTPAVSAEGMQNALEQNLDAVAKGLEAADQMDNSYLGK